MTLILVTTIYHAMLRTEFPRAGYLPFLVALVLQALSTFNVVADPPSEVTRPPARKDASVSLLRGIIEEYTADLAALERRYKNLSVSQSKADRLRRFFEDEAKKLGVVSFEALDQDERVDYLLLQNELTAKLRVLEHAQAKLAEVANLLPFARPILELEEARRRMEPVDSQRAAKALALLSEDISGLQKTLEEKLKAEKGPSQGLPSSVLSSRAARKVDELGAVLKEWNDFYSGYDPEVTWWTRQPYEEVDRALKGYAAFLRAKLAGFAEGKDDPILGDPIGRGALLDALKHEMIAYTPEELIEIANKELAWCEGELKKAAGELGFGDDWHKALERVKELHVKPGEQPKLVRDLAVEAVKFLEDRNLVTIPELSKEIWRMEMLTPQEQKVNPFFTGGEVISLSYPVDTMSYEEKLMSLRGNNIHFSRATVHHELIPGHHLQGFMSSRSRAHRRVFGTPFLIEGWAVYWEMLLWDLGFPRSPEDRVGMLFWRAHRAARIIFSLNFHLGKMSPAEAIDFLVERVGHERRNATAEVRRSVAGDYGPLYQASYMLGALELRSLRRELVDSGKMSDREFHDAVLRENAIPIELIRASLTGQLLTRDFSAQWKFADAQAAARGASDGGAAPKDKPKPKGAETKAPGQVYRDRVEPHWFGGGAKFWYRLKLPGEKRTFILVDALEGKRAPAFDHERLAKALSARLGSTLKEDELPLDSIAFSDDGSSLRLKGEKLALDLNLGTYELTESSAEAREGAPLPVNEGASRDRTQPVPNVKSPDGRWEAYVHGHNLFLRNLESRKEEPLTYDANPNNTYARDASWNRAVEMEYNTPDAAPALPEVSWSPDSRHLVAFRTRPGTQRLVYLVESAPKDQVQPRLQSYPYLKPGDEIPLRKPHLFDVEARREVPVDDSLFLNPWSISEVRWGPDSSQFTFLYNQRGHQVLRIVQVDSRTGEAKAAVEESSNTFIDYAHKRFTEYLDETQEILWMSERDGWNHLYLCDARSGRVKNQITKGEWVVRGVDRVDKEKRQVWFRAGGIRPGQDPYFVHYCRVNFDGAGLVVLTEGDGTHSVQFSPDYRFLVDTWSRVDLPPITELRRAEDGKLVSRLEETDATALFESGWRPPERFVAKGRDGATDIYGILHRPKDLDPGKSYPVLESIYAGPHGSHVPKAFRPSYPQEELTARGFIVVQIDGMGTSNRSKKFHDVCWKNLGDGGFPDRIQWMKAAASKYPYMDLARVGIYGGSAGGQNALGALLFHGDFYKVGAADCGCHDNRMDKIWWNELWMGWPIGQHYVEQSNVTQAHKLQGKLLLTVSELDKNVDPSSTMQVVNALIQADKDFELVVVPGAGHGAGESPYLRRRRAQFFAQHLLGPESARIARGN